MVRKARVWFDEELAWDSSGADEEGAVAVQTQTAVLSKLSEGEPLSETLNPEPEITPDQAHSKTTEPAAPEKKRKPSTERRHLAGANWTDDWTLYLPASQP